MHFVADLHLHSKYSRAVSQQMVLPEMGKWAVKKGLDILSTGDWTHPLWFREVKSQLEEKSEGLYGLKPDVIPNSFRDPPSPHPRLSRRRAPSFAPSPSRGEGRERVEEMLNQASPVQHDDRKEPLFLLSTEIASIYKQGEKLRRIHNLVFAPNLEAAEKINKELVRRGCNLHSDGRPMTGISSKNLLELILAIDERAMLIPCHVWTPHFGIYGSASGFDSLEEAFGNLSKYVYGIETGLSSDPQMNWQMKELENRSILSFSDAHSPAKMGREATVFISQNDNSKFKISYNDIVGAIKRDSNTNLKVGYTIEFYPEEGKYHFSGHRNCGVVRGPEEIRKDGSLCPSCQRQLTEGVLYRVSQLGDRSLAKNHDNKMNSNNIKWYVNKAKNHPPYVKIVPLLEILAEGLESTVGSQKVKTMFHALCAEFGSEINILLKTSTDLIQKIAGSKIKDGIEKVRSGNIVIDPGFDGEYGKVRIWDHDKPVAEKKEDNAKTQLGLGF